MDSKPGIVKPALIGGSVAGVLSAIPIVNMLNCACCALVIGGGFLAGYLHSVDCKKTGQIFNVGTGATVGLLSGLFYGLASGVVGSLFSLITGPQDMSQVISQIEDAGGEMPPWAMNLMESMAGGGFSLIGLLMGVGIGIVVGLIFGTLGGLLSGAVLKSEPPAGGSGVPPTPTTDVA